jgi:glycosyltransferase involved in cell wall biosynthesis
MRILVFYPYIPFPTNRGTYQRTYHLLRALADVHEVDLFCMTHRGIRRDQLAHFETFCKRVQAVPFEHPSWPSIGSTLLHGQPSLVRHWQVPHVREGLDRFMEGQHYDLLHVCDIVLAPYVIDRGIEGAISVDRNRVDYEFQLMKRRFERVSLASSLRDAQEIWKLRWFERRVAAAVQLEVVCSGHDAAFVRTRISPDVPLAVVGNGVDLDFFRPDSVADERASDPTVLFCGTLDYVANVDGLAWFFESMFRELRSQIPGLRLQIVGRNPDPRVREIASYPGVALAADVDDVRPYYRRSWLHVVPLRIGSGTRLKIPESLAIGTPVVSTSTGAEGLDLTHDEHFLCGDTPQAFAAQVRRALTSRALREQLERAGIDVARRRFSWSRFGADLRAAYERLAGEARARRDAR